MINKPKFLIVDDQEEIRSIIKAMLSTYDCECETAADGAEALEILQDADKAAQFDAVFLDLMMPNVNGYQVMEKLRDWDHTRELPVLVLTARVSDDEIIEGYNKGADYYIPKPFTKEQLAYGLDLIFGNTKE